MISAEVKINRKLSGDHHVLTVLAGPTFMEARPGQFVMVKKKADEAYFLPRPISIYDVRDESGDILLDLLIRIVGRGTFALSCLRSGDLLELLGPLGQGFSLPSEDKKTVLIAGGIGIAPLTFLARRLFKKNERNRRELICYIGAQSKVSLCGMDRLRQCCSVVHVSTDDGSHGYEGVVTDLIERDIHQFDGQRTSFYACGPLPMLKTLYNIMNRRSFFCQVSVEERMACGVGACLGCAVRMKGGTYGRVCKDGPVFDLVDLEFE